MSNIISSKSKIDILHMHAWMHDFTYLINYFQALFSKIKKCNLKEKNE
jgi:hypothetical protein